MAGLYIGTRRSICFIIGADGLWRSIIGSMAALYVRLNDAETFCTPCPPGHFAELSRVPPVFRAAQDRLQAVVGNRNVRLAVPGDVQVRCGHL